MRPLARFLSALVLCLGCLPVLAQAPATGTPASLAAGIELIEDLVAQSAQRHGYILTWEARPLAVRGVVLPVSGDIATEMRALQAMLGGERSPLAIEVYRHSSVLRVTDAAEGVPPLRVTEQLFAGRVHRNSNKASALAHVPAPLPAPASAQAAASPHAQTPMAPDSASTPASEPPAVPVAVAAAQAAVVDVAPAATPAPVTVDRAATAASVAAPSSTVIAAQPAPIAPAVAPPAQPASEAPKSIHLSPGLAQAAFARIAAQHDYRLDWAVDEKDSVYAFDFPVTVSGRDITEDLTTLTKALSMNGAAQFLVDVYTGNRIIRVTTKD